MTLRELFREFVLHKRRTIEQANRDIRVAHMTAAFIGQTMSGKGLPTVDKFLIRDRAVATRTPAGRPSGTRSQARAMLDLMRAAFRGKIRVKNGD